MSRYKAYPEYKDSGVELVDSIPEEWDIKPFWTLYSPIKLTGYAEETLLSVYRDHGVVFKHSRDDNRNRASLDLSPYQLIKPGFLVTNKMKTWQGSIAVSEIRGIVSPAYFVYEPVGGMYGKYAHYLLRSLPYIAGYISISKGIRVGQWDLDPDHFRVFPILVPSKNEQIRIANEIDRETTRIDTLIEKKTRFIELLKEKRQALVHKAHVHPETYRDRIQWNVVRIDRPVCRVDDQSYIRLGLYNWGRGIFQKPEAAGDELGSSSFLWVEKDDLILSGQFAWEGAVALVTSNEDGCIVSHRYHVYRGKPDILNTRYLWAYFTSHEGHFLLDDCSHGSAGRNRPLNIDDLAKKRIPIPPMALQNEIARLVEMEYRFKELEKRSIRLLKEKRSALITAAVTGKIDVRDQQTEAV
ncbi:restriction endonuclease subunit S [Vreelandella jeotgali]|uniref:restriction endonuclease subunit S n=1 Tax=Vreelandella jeotgali TaxID=553386 RepID=UPI00034AA6CB|nr:restriction endonuclease subunit S [Halomonas jeotgali]